VEKLHALLELPCTPQNPQRDHEGLVVNETTTRHVVEEFPEKVDVARLAYDVEHLVGGDGGVLEARLGLCVEEEAVNGTP